MRPVPCKRSTALAFIVAAFVPAPFVLPAYANEGGYQLLELDGYKVKWGERRLGTGARVSYAFADETLRFDDARNCSDMAAIDGLVAENLTMETLARETAAAFSVWERAAGLSFHEVDDAREADIILGAQGKPRGRAFANVSSISDAEAGVRTIDQALVCLNPHHKWKIGFDGDEDIYDIRYTLIHEIGHAIGLDHPGPSGQLMAFRYSEALDGLQPGDLRGVRLLYGDTDNDGGLTIGFDSEAPATPTTASSDDPVADHAMEGNAHDEENGSLGALIMGQDGTDTAGSSNDALGIGEKGSGLSRDPMQPARRADRNSW